MGQIFLPKIKIYFSHKNGVPVGDSLKYFERHE